MRRKHVIAFLAWLAVAVLVIASPSAVLAQNPGARDPYRSRFFQPDTATAHTQAFGAIAKSVRELAKKRAANLPEVSRLLLQTEEDATFLQNRVTQWVNRSRGGYPGPPPELDPYFRHVRRISKTLDNAEKLEDTALLELARNISRDLRAKAENCRLSSDGLGKQITVTAHTLKGTNEVRGFEVYFAPMALLDDKAEHNKFPKLSSPTTFKNFPPGYYAIWLKRNSTTNVHTAQTIGGDGQPTFSIDIPVPETNDPKP